MTRTISAREVSRSLDAVVELTRQHDSQQLLAVLRRILQKDTGAARARLLGLSSPSRESEFDQSNVQHATFSDQFDADAGEARPLGGDPDLIACICSGKPVHRETQGGRRAIFPVFGLRHVRALLVLDGVRDDGVPGELLEKLLQVYSNQMLTLSRSEVDALTGLYNRQTFDERVRRMAQRAARQRRAADGHGTAGVCFALLDLDHFKKVNDEYGHLYGDEVLILLARLMLSSFRHEDMLFRYGGEEFAVVLANAELDSAGRSLERFRGSVETYPFPQIGTQTVSIGYTALAGDSVADHAVMCADKALYFAKSNGRNQVRCYEALVGDGKLAPVKLTQGDIELF